MLRLRRSGLSVDAARSRGWGKAYLLPDRGICRLCPVGADAASVDVAEPRFPLHTVAGAP